MPGTPSRWMHEMSYDEVEAHLKKSDVALVPIGATEQHGRHAPMMLDTAWAISASEAAAEIADVLIAPPLHYGWSYMHMGYCGALTLGAETLRRAAEDICISLVWHGFRRVIIVNGNQIANLPPLEIAAARLRNRTGAFVAVADVSQVAQESLPGITEGPPGCNAHAGEHETSMILYRFPEFTDMTKAVDGPGVALEREQAAARRLHHHHLDPDIRRRGDGVWVPRLPHELRQITEASSGVHGDATRATAGKGERIVKAIGRNLAAFIAHARKVKVEVRPVELPV
ncbi:MAG: creatininase family protein [Proteobacteria bacterium]|nr:creatininase family protein [Pseudomonadota bacterium]